MKNGRWTPGSNISRSLKSERKQFAAISWALGAALAALVFLPALLSAKKKPPVLRSVSGEVMDAASNGVDGATVELTDLATNKTLASYTVNGGHYSFTGLDPHHDYRVQAKLKGMVSRVRGASSLNPSNDIVINLTLDTAKP